MNGVRALKAGVAGPCGLQKTGRIPNDTAGMKQRVRGGVWQRLGHSLSGPPRLWQRAGAGELVGDTLGEFSFLELEPGRCGIPSLP